ncbi:MAG: hypothetical protein PVI75_06015 [Gammaproteobacteria bacterium]
MSENYHKPAAKSKDFYDKFGCSLQQNDMLYKEFLPLRQQSVVEYKIIFNADRDKIFCAVLREIVDKQTKGTLGKFLKRKRGILKPLFILPF